MWNRQLQLSPGRIQRKMVILVEVRLMQLSVIVEDTPSLSRVAGCCHSVWGLAAIGTPEAAEFYMSFDIPQVFNSK